MEEMSPYQSGKHNSWRNGNSIYSYRKVFPQLVAENKRLWMKIELADYSKAQISEALYTGRLEIIAVDDEPFADTLKVLRSYVLARGSLGRSTGINQIREMEHLADSPIKLPEQFSMLVDLFHAVQDENEMLAEAAQAGDQLRADPLALVLWLEGAGRRDQWP